ncbi:MAG: hypothetical protein ABL921_18095 [Pirellula sp.]
MNRCWTSSAVIVWLMTLGTLVPVGGQETSTLKIDARKTARASEFSDALKELARVTRPSVVSISSIKRIAPPKAPERRQRLSKTAYPEICWTKISLNDSLTCQSREAVTNNEDWDRV